jgi:hypothetical protein
MKKIRNILMLVIVLSLLFHLPVQSTFNVTVGTILQYDKIESYWDFSLDGNQSIGSGFQFEEINYPNNTLLTVQATNVDATSVSFNETVNAVNDTGSMSHFGFALGFALICFYPVLIADVIDPWNQTLRDLGVGLFGWYFIDHGESSTLLNDFSNPTYLEENFDDTEYNINRMIGNYNITGNLAIFNWLLDCTFIGESGLDNFAGNYTYQFAYDTTTSILQGFEMYINYSGLLDGYQRSLFYYHICEIEGYDLPDFYYEVDVYPEPEPTPTPTPTPTLTPTPTPTETSGLFIGSIIASCIIGTSIIYLKRRFRK